MENLYDDIIARIMVVARNNAIAPRVVMNEQGSMGGRKGGTHDFVVLSDMVAQDIDPDNDNLAPQQTEKVVPVTLSNWKEVVFGISDKDLALMSVKNDYIPAKLESAAATLADAVSSEIYSHYKGVYGVAGVAGTAPFGTSVIEAQSATLTLMQQKAPVQRPNKSMVLDPVGYTNALGLDALQRADAYGSGNVIKSGLITQPVLGYLFQVDQNIPYHTRGAAGTILVNGAVSVGATTAGFDGATTKPAVGDIFTVAGDTQTYTVLSSTNLSGTATTVTFAPAALVGWADNAAVTFRNSHRVNLALLPEAIAHVQVPDTGMNIPGAGPVIRSWADDVSGCVFNLRLDGSAYKSSFRLSCLWGTKLIEPRFAVRVLG